MTPNKKVVEAYLASRSNVPPLLADDAEWVEWGDGVPASGVRTQGKAAFVQGLGDSIVGTEVTRMIEENNVVVAEGRVRATKKEGGFAWYQFCDIFELENGKVKRLSSYAAAVEPPA
jgi:uncharacterized protein